jgi:predicted 3-demethylubiquinone-9 3-methyltransferase (glyoxalase superfamily)
MPTIQKISPHLWFDKQAEDAANYYVSIFKNSRITKISHYGKEGFEIHNMSEGTVMTVEFELEGQQFVALNGGPIFKFNESISFMINCTSQEEIDYYWEKLSTGGDPKSQQCGWLKDKFGVSWQVAPRQLAEMFSDADRERSERVMRAMLRMKKLILTELEEAYNGEAVAH